jgi:hypothetical protein
MAITARPRIAARGAKSATLRRAQHRCRDHMSVAQLDLRYAPGEPPDDRMCTGARSRG